MYENTLTMIRTQDDLLQAIDDTRLLRDSLFKTGEGGFEHILKEQVSSRFSGAIRSDMESSKLSVAAFFEGLIERLQSVKILKLTIAFQPSEAMVNRIADWVHEHVGQDVVVQITYRKQVVGGAIVEFGGEYRDFSISKKMTPYFEEQLSVLVALVKK